MNHSEVRAAIDEYLALVTRGGPDAEARLARILDRLALVVGELEFEFDDEDRSDPQGTEYSEWRARAEKAFPNLGHYNAARPVSQAIGEGQVVVGDAIDDVADIARDLEEVALRWGASPEDALWHLDQSFRFHWGAHLRNLQLYLHMERVGW